MAKITFLPKGLLCIEISFQKRTSLCYRRGLMSIIKGRQTLDKCRIVLGACLQFFNLCLLFFLFSTAGCDMFLCSFRYFCIIMCIEVDFCLARYICANVVLFEISVICFEKTVIVNVLGIKVMLTNQG